MTLPRFRLLAAAACASVVSAGGVQAGSLPDPMPFAPLSGAARQAVEPARGPLDGRGARPSPPGPGRSAADAVPAPVSEADSLVLLLAVLGGVGLAIARRQPR